MIFNSYPNNMPNHISSILNTIGIRMVLIGRTIRLSHSVLPVLFVPRHTWMSIIMLEKLPPKPKKWRSKVVMEKTTPRPTSAQTTTVAQKMFVLPFAFYSVWKFIPIKETSLRGVNTQLHYHPSDVTSPLKSSRYAYCVTGDAILILWKSENQHELTSKISENGSILAARILLIPPRLFFSNCWFCKWVVRDFESWAGPKS